MERVNIKTNKIKNKMSWLIRSGFLLFSISLVPSLYAESYENQVINLAQETFENSASLALVEVDIKSMEKFEELMKPAKTSFDETRFQGAYIFSSDQIVGYCFVVNEIGKEMPITFLVCLNPDNSVRFIEVLKYRETRGGEIRSKMFLKQFQGKKTEDKITVGHDIKNIRGATLSAWATTRAVRKSFAIKKSIDEKIANVSVKSIFQRKISSSKSSRCYEVGDTFLCLTCNCSEKDFIKIHEFVSGISKEFSDFYFQNIMSSRIKELVDKYEKSRKEIAYFDIYWKGDGKPDLGGVWKGYVVDVLAEFMKSIGKEEFEINFGWSSFYFSKPTAISVLGRKIIHKGAVSVSDSDSEYSEIFDPVASKFVRNKGKVAVLHTSAEFSDFASTLCIIWEECAEFIKNKGGVIIRETNKH